MATTRRDDATKRFDELLDSARSDEQAGRLEAAELKLRLALAYSPNPEVQATLDRILRARGGQAKPSSQGSGIRRAPVPTLFFSVLHRQRLALSRGFAVRYPNPWLVWEAGPWRPSAGPIERDTKETVLPSRAGAARPKHDDPLCFALVGNEPIRVGRGDGCLVQIDDVTFSRDLGLVAPEGQQWVFKPATGGSTVLRPGLTLQNGDVTLTFESVESFAARLDAVRHA